MVIETHSSIDSRYVLYNLVDILSRIGDVKVKTANKAFHDFEGENNIDIDYMDEMDMYECDNNIEDYIICDNILASVPDKIIYYVTPYDTDFDINNIAKDSIVIRVMEGQRLKYKQPKNVLELTDSQANRYYLSKRPLIKTLPTYEEIYRYEQFGCKLNRTPELLNIYSKECGFIKNTKNAVERKGGGDRNEHNYEKLSAVLW